jgi:hypothetical protein
MKASLTTILLCIGLAFATQVHAQESAPTLSIADATRSAQVFLDQQKLPKEYFIRSITLTGSPGSASSAQYEARFEPTKARRVKIGPAPEPIKYQVIVVTMDGTATIQEREFTPTRRIIATPGSTTGGTNQ